MENKNINSFLVGAGVHLLLWLPLINFDSTKFDFLCGETSCYALAVVDLPVSLIFISGDQAVVTYGSLILGSVWWGALFSFFYMAVKRIKPAA
jgi:hypothetical protein